MKQICALLILVALQAPAADGPSTFFANASVQRLAPAAFALQPEASLFIQSVDAATQDDRAVLVRALAQHPTLGNAIRNWGKLSLEQQIPLLKMIFAIEVQTLKMVPPTLVIENDATPGPAYFDFDPKKPGPGKVILNPKALATSKNKYESLLLLIHETRHADQFQQAFLNKPSALPARQNLKEGFAASFIAQKAFSQQIRSFVDFTTLLNEYEAFRFANGVVTQLTQGQADTLDMGTFASQFDKFGTPLIDLAKLAERVTPTKLLEAFNTLEKKQYDLIQAQKPK